MPTRLSNGEDPTDPVISAPPPRILVGRVARTFGAKETQNKPLESSTRYHKILNELDILPDSHVDREKPFYRRTTFVVSLVVSLVVILAGVGWLTYRHFSAPPTSVTGLRLLEVDENTLLMSWNGPNVPYQAVLTTEDARDPKDITQMIRGREVWIPRNGVGLTGQSCFVVRPLIKSDERVFTSDSGLKRQGAAMICMNQITPNDAKG